MKILTTPVSSYRVECPTCRALFRLSVDDGDAAGTRNLTKEQTKGLAYICHAEHGRCASCGESYYVINVRMMAGEQDKEGHNGASEPYLCLTAPDVGVERSLLCRPDAPTSDVPAQWLLGEYDTPAGLMHNHSYGPFRLPEVTGSQSSIPSFGSWNEGVWLQANVHVQATWDAMRELLEAQCAETA